MSANTCIICAKTIAATANTGRPKRYCGTPCRRLMEFKIRNLRERMNRLDNRLSQLRHTKDSGHRDGSGRRQSEQITDAESELRSTERELLTMLSADDD